MKLFHPELMTKETLISEEFESFDHLVDFGQKNSENRILTIETLRKDERTRETHEFINFKP